MAPNSPNTVVMYLRDLSLFFDWLHTEQLGFWEVKAADIPRFMVFADHQGWGLKAPATINRILATLSAFYRFVEVRHSRNRSEPWFSLIQKGF